MSPRRRLAIVVAVALLVMACLLAWPGRPPPSSGPEERTAMQRRAVGPPYWAVVPAADPAPGLTEALAGPPERRAAAVAAWFDQEERGRREARPWWDVAPLRGIGWMKHRSFLKKNAVLFQSWVELTEGSPPRHAERPARADRRQREER